MTQRRALTDGPWLRGDGGARPLVPGALAAFRDIACATAATGHGPEDYDVTDSGEVMRYRVHIIITADGFTRPESFRTDVYADSHNDARDRAVTWARLQPLTGMTVQVIGCELQGDQTGRAPLVEPLTEELARRLWGAGS